MKTKTVHYYAWLAICVTAMIQVVACGPKEPAPQEPPPPPPVAATTTTVIDTCLSTSQCDDDCGATIVKSHFITQLEFDTYIDSGAVGYNFTKGYIKGLIDDNTLSCADRDYLQINLSAANVITLAPINNTTGSYPLNVSALSIPYITNLFKFYPTANKITVFQGTYVDKEGKSQRTFVFQLKQNNTLLPYLGNLTEVLPFVPGPSAK